VNITRLRQRLAEWESLGFLTGDQRQRIEAHEAGRSHGAAGQRVAWILGGLGSVSVGAGIISVVAANWDVIPAGVKLFCGVALLCASLLGARAVVLPWLRTALLTLYVGLVLANIGLVAQVYHLSGAPWRPFAVTALFALPAAWVATHALLSYVALGMGLTALIAYLEQSHRWFSRLSQGDLRPLLLGVMLGLVAMAAAPWLETVHAAAGRALRRFGLGLLAAVQVIAAIFWSTPSGFAPRLTTFEGIFWSLALLACAGLLYSWQRKELPALGVTAGALALGLFLMAGLYGVPKWDELVRELVPFALFCGCWTAVAIAAAIGGHPGGVHLGTFAVAARIFVLYLQLVEDLMTTGLGLITTGVVFFLIAWGWWRMRALLPRLAHSAVEGAQP